MPLPHASIQPPRPVVRMRGSDFVHIPGGHTPEKRPRSLYAPAAYAYAFHAAQGRRAQPRAARVPRLLFFVYRHKHIGLDPMKRYFAEIRAIDPFHMFDRT